MSEQPLRLVRPRTVLYAALIAVVSAIMLAAWLNRSVLNVDVLHDRNPLYVELTDGGVRNGYTLKILNKVQKTRSSGWRSRVSKDDVVVRRARRGDARDGGAGRPARAESPGHGAGG